VADSKLRRELLPLQRRPAGSCSAGAKATGSAFRPTSPRRWWRGWKRLFPQLKGVGIAHVWGGSLGITMTRLPHVARVGPTSCRGGVLGAWRGAVGHGGPGHGAPNVYDAEPIPEAARAEIDRLLQSGDLFRYTAPEDAPVALLEREFADLMGAKYALAVSSCSAAMFLSLKALDLPPARAS
jgi:hypothetical protein